MADSPNKTVLGPGCRISGELALDNDAVIMGQFKGTLRVSGMLELADSSEVAGTVIVGTLRLAGRAEADIIAEDGVELLPGAELIGQVYTSRLNVIEGASFQGDVCIGPKAIEAATEAFNLEAQEQPEPQVQQQPAPQPQTQQHHQPISSGYEHDDMDDQQDDDGSVHTVPGSVNKVLQRRRPKILVARNGNGVH